MTKICPFCAEEIKEEAIKCKHCGSMLDEEESSSFSASFPVKEDTKRSIGCFGKTISFLFCLFIIGFLLSDNKNTKKASVPSNSMYCKIENLNVREGAGANYKKIGKLSINDKVDIQKESGEWAYFVDNDKFPNGGWVSKKYLSTDAEEGQGSSVLFKLYNAAKNQTQQAEKPPIRNYKILSHTSKTMLVEPYEFENIAILLFITDKSEKNIEKIATEIKKKECKIPCNIDFWDDEKAYELDKQKKPGELAGKDYIFVADHLIGMFSFEGGAFWFYPYKDWYYKELKHKQDTNKSSAQDSYDDITISKVISVYDGDTFRADIKGHPDISGKDIPIRIYGIDTPEKRGGTSKTKKLAQRATMFAKQQLKNGKKIVLKNVRRGKYFRIIAEVWIDNVSLGNELIKAGLAKPYGGGKRPTWP